MFDKMKKLMEVQRQAQEIKKQLDNTCLDVQDVPGIRITITGSQEIRCVEIDPHLLGAENKDRLQAALIKSINAAIGRAQGAASQKMAALMPKFS